jgi:hypothetical protein
VGFEAHGMKQSYMEAGLMEITEFGKHLLGVLGGFLG